MNFAKFLRTPLFTEHLWWLLLYSTDMTTTLSELDNKEQLVLLGIIYLVHSQNFPKN